MQLLLGLVADADLKAVPPIELTCWDDDGKGKVDDVIGTARIELGGRESDGDPWAETNWYRLRQTDTTKSVGEVRPAPDFLPGGVRRVYFNSESYWVRGGRCNSA